MEQFQHFLHLNASNNRRRCWRSWDFPLGHLLVRQKGTGFTLVNEPPVHLCHGAFIASSLTWNKHSCKAIQRFNCPIDPRAVHLITGLVDCKTSFSVVKATKHNIRPAKDAQANIIDDIGDKRFCFDIRIDFHCPFRSNLSFITADISCTIENGAGKVRAFNGIHIIDKDAANSEKCQIFNQLISDCACTYNHNRSIFQPVLIPPRNQTQTTVAIFFKIRII